jgi:hypothetical protein
MCLSCNNWRLRQSAKTMPVEAEKTIPPKPWPRDPHMPEPASYPPMPKIGPWTWHNDETKALREQVRVLKLDLANVTATADARLALINDMSDELKKQRDPARAFVNFIRANRVAIKEALR